MNDLEIFRTELDEIDKKLIDFLSMRFKLVEKIWKYKKKHNITPLQPERFACSWIRPRWCWARCAR